jgi:O-antigen/teichoic acid export membrane protein
MSKTLTNVFFATAGVLFAQGLGSLRALVLARLIEPAEYGIWIGVQMIVTLSPIVCLGTVEALLKQVPYFRGKADSVALEQVEGSVFATMALSAAVIAGLFLVGHSLLPTKFVQQNLFLAQITAASAAIGFFRAFYYHRCAAYEDFKSVSKIDSLQSLAGFVFVLLFAWKWGLVGGIIGFFVGECLTWAVAGYLSGKAHGVVRPRFQLLPMINAARIGFPITVIWWVYALQATVGRMLALSVLGTTETGYYGAASSFAMLLSLVPNTIGRVFYPRVNAQVGANAALQDLRHSVVMPTAAIALILPIAQVAIFYLMPFIFNELLPKYKAGLTCAQILVLGTFFVGLIRNGANYLIAVNRQLHLMKYVGISLLINAAGCAAFLKLGFGINGIAVATSLASALLATLIWKRVFTDLKYDRKSQISIFAGYYSSFLSTLLALGIVNVGFSGFAAYSRALLPIKMILALSICSALLLSVSGSREQLRDLYRRAVTQLAFRFRPPVVK